MNPNLAVIIATYNRGPRIGETLDSVLAQTLAPREILVVDDCSPDGTGDWVRSHYPTVRVVRPEQNGGTSAARNYGARLVSADRLVFLDHDDLLRPHALATLSRLFAQFPEAQAVHADHSYTNLVTGETYPDHHQAMPAFHRLRSVPVVRSVGPARLYSRPLFLALLQGNVLQQPWAIDRSLFLSLGGFAPEIRYCEDWDLYLRVTAAGPVVVSDEVIADHRVEGANLHLAEGQEAMQQQVIRRVLSANRFDAQVQWTLRRRLGLYLKAEGDRAATPFAAWGAYLRSVAAWPFDAVVVARALVLLPLKAAWTRRRTP